MCQKCKTHLPAGTATGGRDLTPCSCRCGRHSRGTWFMHGPRDPDTPRGTGPVPTSIDMSSLDYRFVACTTCHDRIHDKILVNKIPADKIQAPYPQSGQNHSLPSTICLLPVRLRHIVLLSSPHLPAARPSTVKLVASRWVLTAIRRCPPPLLYGTSLNPP